MKMKSHLNNLKVIFKHLNRQIIVLVCTVSFFCQYVLFSKKIIIIFFSKDRLKLTKIGSTVLLFFFFYKCCSFDLSINQRIINMSLFS